VEESVKKEFGRIFCGFAAKNRAIRSNSSKLLRNFCGVSASIPCAPKALRSAPA
jgi:hypothetical protein